MFVIEPRSDLCVFAYVGLLDLVLGEGHKGMLLSAPFVRLRGSGRLPRSPSCSFCFLGENGGLRRDRTSRMQTHSRRLNSGLS